jgi:hypothetical protein
MSDGRHTHQRSGFTAASIAVTEHNRLSRQLMTQLVPLLGKTNVPPEVKIYIGLTILLVVSLSAGLVILVINLIARLGGIQDIHFEYYLLYMSFILLSLLIVLLVTSAPARRFENTANLEFNMESVIQARRSRKREIVIG